MMRVFIDFRMMENKNGSVNAYDCWYCARLCEILSVGL